MEGPRVQFGEDEFANLKPKEYAVAVATMGPRERESFFRLLLKQLPAGVRERCLEIHAAACYGGTWHDAMARVVELCAERTQKTPTEIAELAIFRRGIDKGLLPLFIRRAQREKCRLAVRRHRKSTKG